MRPTIPDVIDRFAAYRRDHPTWGSLHVILDDGNTRDCFCDLESEQYALDRGDHEGAELIAILRSMSRTQRNKLYAIN